jgi:uncharacterized protein YcbK (DUF882 family)
MEMDEGFMDRIVILRQRAGFSWPVTSGYRCPGHDAKVGGSERRGAGPHTMGRALDVAVHGERAFILLGIVIVGGMTGIGARQRGEVAGRYLHIDNLKAEEFGGARPIVWTYS